MRSTSSTCGGNSEDVGRNASKREGDARYSTSGSRAGVAVLLLVKRPGPVTEPADDSLPRHRRQSLARREAGPYRPGGARCDPLANDHAQRARGLDQPAQPRLSRAAPGHFNPERASRARLAAGPAICDCPRSELITSRDAWMFNSSGAKLRDLIPSAGGVLQRAGQMTASAVRGMPVMAPQPPAIQVGQRNWSNELGGVVRASERS